MASEVVDRSGSSAQTAGGSTEVSRSQIRGSSLLLVGNVISLAITFLPHVLLVRYLTTEAYGHLTYALSVVAVCKGYSLGFNEAMSRFVPIYHAKHEPSKVFGTIVVVFAITLSISALFVAAFGLASRQILGLLTHGREPAGLLFIVIFLVPLETMETLIMNLFACFARAKVIFWGRYIVSPGLRAIVLGVIVFKNLGLPSLVIGYVLCGVVTVLPFGVLLLRELRRQRLLLAWKDLNLPIREIFGFSAPLMASNLVGLAGNSMPVLLIGYFHPMSTVAFYRVVLPAAVLSNMILGNFMPLYMPAASRLFAKGDTHGMNDLFWQTALWMGLLSFPIFVVTWCFAGPVTIFLYGARYTPSAPILAILSLGYYVNAIFGFNSVTMKVMGKIRAMVILNIVTPIITVLLNLMLIPHFGALGAAVATAAGLILQCLLRQIGMWRGGSISFFEMRYASVFFVLGSSAVALYLIQWVIPSNIYSALITAAAVSALVLWLVKKQLRIVDTFPEILRLPIVGRLFA